MIDNGWTTCPECDQKILESIEDVIKKVHDNYGNAGFDYVNLKEKVKKLKNQSRQMTLRENCEIGIHEGEFEILYTSSCSRCGFSHTFTHHENVS